MTEIYTEEALPQPMRLVFDIEANGFVDESNVDYTASPFKLKDHFKVWCIVACDVVTNKYYLWEPEQVARGDFKKFIQTEDIECIVGHNILGYDLPVLKAALGIDYSVGFSARGEIDTVCGKPIQIIDTLVMSKVLNPDRPAHSLDYFGGILGLAKINYRARAMELGVIPPDAPSGAEFKQYHPEMLVYNQRDVELNIRVWKMLQDEWGTHDWQAAFNLESCVADIISRQSQRGFWFDIDTAYKLVADLDQKMRDRRELVEPLLPPKPLTQAKRDIFTPPVKQIKKDGSPTSYLEKWAAKMEGKLEADEFQNWTLTVRGKTYSIPMPLDPIETHEAATLEDTTHLKQWLVSLGWVPSAWKERDLTVDSKKVKLSPEKFAAAVERYVEQTLSSPFGEARLEHLQTTPARVLMKLMGHDTKRPLKVLTNPQLTVGQDKDICPNLALLQEVFPYAREVADFLTYRHRRNSILGGGFDPDEAEEGEEPEKGYIANMRGDHRIPTPADSCGCNTSRMKHRLVNAA